MSPYSPLRLRVNLWRTYATLWSQKWVVLRLMVLPMLGSSIVFLVGDLVQANRAFSREQFWLITFAVQAVDFVFYAWFTFHLMRFMLLGPQPRGSRLGGYNMLLFLEYFLVFLCIYGVIVLVGYFWFWLLTLLFSTYQLFEITASSPAFYGLLLLGFGVIFAFYPRVAFLLPQMAVDDGFDLPRAWRASGPHWLRIFALLLSLLLIVAIPFLAFLFLLRQYFPPTSIEGADALVYVFKSSYIPSLIFSEFVAYLLCAVVHTGLAISYYYCTSWGKKHQDVHLTEPYASSEL